MRPRARRPGRFGLLVAGDALAASFAFAAAVLLRRGVRLPGTIGRIPVENLVLDPVVLAAAALAAVVGLALAATYEEPAAEVRERGGLLTGALVSAGLMLLFFFLSGRAFPRTVLLVWLPLLLLAVGVWRWFADAVAPIQTRPVLVLGAGEDARRAAEALGAGDITGHRLHAWLTDPASLGPDGAEVPADVRDVVFATDRAEARAALVTLLEKSDEQGFDLWILPGLADVVASRVVTRSLGDLPVMPVSTRGASWPARSLRRVLDLTLGLALLAATLPLLALVSAAVVLDSRGPAWIRQTRVGRGGRPFGMPKVRTMRADAESATGPVLAERNDPRLTRLGAFLRATRLDELPQLLLVVGGSMSLIGPRPERPEFVSAYEKEVPAYRLRHLLKPGITGLAQVMGAYATKTDVKLRYDLGYLFHWSPVLDLFILARTVTSVLKRSGT